MLYVAARRAWACTVCAGIAKRGALALEANVQGLPVGIAANHTGDFSRIKMREVHVPVGSGFRVFLHQLPNHGKRQRLRHLPIQRSFRANVLRDGERWPPEQSSLSRGGNGAGDEQVRTEVTPAIDS